jgi:hypothetical protein
MIGGDGNHYLIDGGPGVDSCYDNLGTNTFTNCEAIYR